MFQVASYHGFVLSFSASFIEFASKNPFLYLPAPPSVGTGAGRQGRGWFGISVFGFEDLSSKPQSLDGAFYSQYSN
jgi:hypothetical protein